MERDKFTPENKGIGEVLYRYLTRRTSAEEDELIYAWLARSETNRRTFFEIAAVWSAHRTLASPALETRCEEMLQRLNARIDAAGAMRSSARRPRPVWRRWMSAAAAAAVVTVVVTAMWLAGVRLPGGEEPGVYVNRTGEIAALRLEDGTQVWLQPLAEVRYAVKGARERIVQLEGEACFDVAHDAARPLLVETRNLRIRVLGTAFNVRAPGAGTLTEVVLERGSVQLETPAGGSLTLLSPDQMALYDAATGNVMVEEVDAARLIRERYDLVSIKNATLPQIIAAIETDYGVRIQVASPDDERRYDLNYLRSYPLEEVVGIVEFMTGRRCEVIRSE